MDTEDGQLWVVGVGEDGVMAITDDGIENLKEMMAIHKGRPQHHRTAVSHKRGGKNQRTAASAEPTGRAPSHRRSHSSTTTSAMPTLQKTNRRKAPE